MNLYHIIIRNADGTLSHEIGDEFTIAENSHGEYNVCPSGILP